MAHTKLNLDHAMQSPANGIYEQIHKVIKKRQEVIDEELKKALDYIFPSGWNEETLTKYNFTHKSNPDNDEYYLGSMLLLMVGMLELNDGEITFNVTKHEMNDEFRLISSQNMAILNQFLNS